MRETIKKENIDCDWHDSLTVDVAMDKTWVRTMKEALNAYRQAGGTAASGTKWIDDAAEARRMTRVPTAQGACVFQAASCYPYKLVCGLLDIAVKKGLHIYTRAPATSMTQHPDGTTTIDTPKGAVIAHKVIHCQKCASCPPRHEKHSLFLASAFVATLLPEFVGKITPCEHFSGHQSSVIY